jgi:hypothetical protein
MTQRIVKDRDGRVWTCTPAPVQLSGKDAGAVGRDVKLSCSTPSIPTPVLVTVGWGWEKMADNGLARLIVAAEAA